MNKDQDNTKNNLSHIGIIMDGNGRWAKQRGFDRSKGHINGIQAVKDSLSTALKFGVPYVSIYVFSTENWKRPRAEVNFILETVAGNLRSHYPFYREHKIKVIHSGNKALLNKKILKELAQVEDDTKNNTALTLNLAFNHGGYDEIIRAVNKYISETDFSTPTHQELDIDTLRNYFDHPNIPNIDLLIRTGAEKRISNFMLWHIAYAELYFSDVLWPDWNYTHMKEAIEYYHTKNRRFGGLSS